MDQPVVGHLGLASEGSCLTDILSPHPTYLEDFSTLHDTILEGDGPLPHHIRYYIAMMAASRHQCSHLIEEQKCLFLDAGGTPAWLDGLDCASKKMQALHTTNKLLAHRPWAYQKCHIEELLSNSWSLSEATQALCILSQFHSLCSIVYGTGLESTSDSILNQCSGPCALEQTMLLEGSPTCKELTEGGIEILLERMKNISIFEKGNNVPEDQVIKSFDQLKSQSLECESPQQDKVLPLQSFRYSHLSPEPEYTYVNFGRRKDTNFPILTTQDCSWEEHCFSILSEMYSEIGDILDKKFQNAYEMTYYTCGDRTYVDTLPFRKAVWYYVHCLFGIRYPCYNYRQVNLLIEPHLKNFIKCAACYPERMGSDLVDSKLMKDFMPSEKVHVLVLVMEARLQAELLYCMRAVGKYML